MEPQMYDDFLKMGLDYLYDKIKKRREEIRNQMEEGMVTDLNHYNRLVGEAQALYSCRDWIKNAFDPS